MSFLDSHILTLIIFLPLVVGLIIPFLPSLSAAKFLSMAGAVLTFLATVYIWIAYEPNQGNQLAFVQEYEWIPALGIRYLVGVDGISLLLVVLTGFLTPLILLSQWQVEGEKQKTFLSLFMVLECGMMGALVALDFVFFYIFWEAMLIPMYFIIGIWGGKRRIYATTKFIIYTVVGSLLMLVAAIGLYLMHYEQFGRMSTSVLDMYQVTITGDAQTWLFLAFALAFAIKVPLWPFHTWLPDAHVEAPTAGSVILAGVLLKMGTYGLLRFAIPLFPEATTTFAPVIVTLGIIGVIYGALTAWMQEDAKKMVAYSSVSHLGFVVIGSFAIIGGTELSVEALMGAVYQMINHGISTGALFFLVGMIYERRHTRMLSDFGGLAKVMPWYAVMLIVVTMSSVGLPGTGGFVGEFLILIGLFQASPAAAIFACLGVLLGAVYMLTLCRAILFGPIKHEANKTLKDLSPLEFSYIAPLAILSVVMGVVPGLFIDKIKPSVEYLAKNYQSYHLVASADESYPVMGTIPYTIDEPEVGDDDQSVGEDE